MKEFIRGVKAGVPIGLGYLSVSFTFGIICITYGLTWWEAVLISMTTVTSAGQFAGVQTMVLPGMHLVETLISQLTINIRYSFMSISLSQKVESRFKGLYRWILGFFMTDEIFAVAISEDEVKIPFFAGLAVLPYFGWALGTLLGALLGQILPDSVMSALGIAIYGMFVAIVIPEMQKYRPVIYVVLFAILFSTCFTYMPGLRNVSAGLSISICAIVSSILGACFWPVKEETDEIGAESRKGDVE